jgi:hypothetical protein
VFPLSFGNYMHRLDAAKNDVRAPEIPKPEHGANVRLDRGSPPDSASPSSFLSVMPFPAS